MTKRQHTLSVCVEVRTISSKALVEMNFTRKSSQETKARSKGRRLLKCGEIQQERETTEKEMIEEGGGDSEHQRKASIDFTNTNQRAHGRNLFQNGSVFGWTSTEFHPLIWGVSRL